MSLPVIRLCPSYTAATGNDWDCGGARCSAQNLMGSPLNEIENALRFQSIGEIRLGSSASNDGFNKVGNGVNERVFVAEDVARGPPVFDVRMARFRDDDVAKSVRMFGILGIIESKAIHIL